MNRSICLSALALLVPLTACGDGSKTADVVQAATRGAAELGQQLAEKTAELAHMAPEEAKAKLQGVLDAAGRELKEIKDSETAQKIAAELQLALDKLVELAKKLGQKIDLAGIKQSVVELIERFKNDPRVTSTLHGLQEKLDSLTR
jgi:hypothetical protein